MYQSLEKVLRPFGYCTGRKGFWIKNTSNSCLLIEFRKPFYGGIDGKFTIVISVYYKTEGEVVDLKNMSFDRGHILNFGVRMLSDVPIDIESLMDMNSLVDFNERERSVETLLVSYVAPMLEKMDTISGLVEILNEQHNLKYHITTPLQNMIHNEGYSLDFD
ncbi:hypothetical protein GO730_20995 [Spirosoma sp. HMF3257]|uniref:hypothetical protein n=1 Tax=Spirosoma telluris TaxID=2183553 RepID=UPI0012F73897|nr:hypothetical protein [Spirosoma telluris]